MFQTVASLKMFSFCSFLSAYRYVRLSESIDVCVHTAMTSGVVFVVMQVFESVCVSVTMCVCVCECVCECEYSGF